MSRYGLALIESSGATPSFGRRRTISPPCFSQPRTPIGHKSGALRPTRFRASIKPELSRWGSGWSYLHSSSIPRPTWTSAEKQRKTRCVALLLGALIGLGGCGVGTTRIAGAPPAVPYEDHGGCLFECCTYRMWTVEAGTDVRRDRREDSPVAFRLHAGERVDVVAGRCNDQGRQGRRARAQLDRRMATARCWRGLLRSSLCRRACVEGVGARRSVRCRCVRQGRAVSE